MCKERPNPRLEYWGGKCSEPQSASEHATSTSRQNCVQIQYLNPSRLEPVARAHEVTLIKSKLTKKQRGYFSIPLFKECQRVIRK